MTPWVPTWDATPDRDPSAILATADVSTPGVLVATVGTTWTRDPDDGVSWSVELPAEVGPTDLVRVVLDVETTAPVPQLIAWAGLSEGPVSPSSRFVGAGLVGDQVTGWRVAHDAAGTYTGAGVIDPYTRGAGLQLALGTTSTQVRVSAYPLAASPTDPTLLHARPGNTGTSSSSAVVGPTWDRVFVALGRSMGATSPATVTVGVSVVVVELDDLAGLGPIADHDPSWTAPTAYPTSIAVLGNSLATGTEAGPYSGTAVPAGATYHHAGGTYTTWPSYVTPATSLLPYLVADMLAASPGGPVEVRRRSSNGTSAAYFPTLLSDFRTDAAAWGCPQAVVLLHGGVDATTQAMADAYQSELEGFAQGLEATCDVTLEVVELPGTVQVYGGTVRTAQAAVAGAGARGSRRLVGTTGLALEPDGIHVDAATATPPGYEDLAGRCWAQLP